jgi:hypothetical protein
MRRILASWCCVGNQCEIPNHFCVFSSVYSYFLCLEHKTNYRQKGTLEPIRFFERGIVAVAAQREGGLICAALSVSASRVRVACCEKSQLEETSETPFSAALSLPVALGFFCE